MSGGVGGRATLGLQRILDGGEAVDRGANDIHPHPALRQPPRADPAMGAHSGYQRHRVVVHIRVELNGELARERGLRRIIRHQLHELPQACGLSGAGRPVGVEVARLAGDDVAAQPGLEVDDRALDAAGGLEHVGGVAGLSVACSRHVHGVKQQREHGAEREPGQQRGQANPCSQPNAEPASPSHGAILPKGLDGRVKGPIRSERRRPGACGRPPLRPPQGLRRPGRR